MRTLAQKAKARFEQVYEGKSYDDPIGAAFAEALQVEMEARYADGGKMTPSEEDTMINTLLKNVVQMRPRSTLGVKYEGDEVRPLWEMTDAMHIPVAEREKLREMAEAVQAAGRMPAGMTVEDLMLKTYRDEVMRLNGG